MKISWEKGSIYIDDKDVTLQSRQSQYGRIASVVAQYNAVRCFINQMILKISETNNIIVDGRDIGSEVLPNATVKIFLEADITTRAIRRLKEDSKHTNATLEINEVINEIIERDNRDYTRPIAPLIKTPDAVVIDSSDLTIDETCDKVKRAFMKAVTNDKPKNEF